MPDGLSVETDVLLLSSSGTFPSFGALITVVLSSSFGIAVVGTPITVLDGAPAAVEGFDVTSSSVGGPFFGACTVGFVVTTLSVAGRALEGAPAAVEGFDITSSSVCGPFSGTCTVGFVVTTLSIAGMRVGSGLGRIIFFFFPVLSSNDFTIASDDFETESLVRSVDKICSILSNDLSGSRFVLSLMITTLLAVALAQ